MHDVGDWLRAHGLKAGESGWPDSELEGNVCGRSQGLLLPCLLPRGHEGPCDPEFERLLEETKARVVVTKERGEN